MPTFVIPRVLIHYCKQSFVCEIRRNNSSGQDDELRATLLVTMGGFNWLTLWGSRTVYAQHLLKR
ncbi:hypothetical protein D9M08_10440 [Escherichia albertii]|nr:hypothetical protein [Escherichia albertii]EEW4358061.1 hypothetical protein [Escherichia albertii]EEW6710165.1 hypothetical protein [Escherichia albertii]EEW7550233.1 hypothetical protein [Escherichia albertii]EFO0320860.1 hypothetical protein [Escherichia albertii]